MNNNRQRPGGLQPGMRREEGPGGFGNRGPQGRDMNNRSSMDSRRNFGMGPGGFDNHGPQRRGMDDRPGMDTRRHEPPRDYHHSENSMGNGLLGVLGAGIAAVVSAQEQAKEQEYQREQEQKREEEAAKQKEAEEKKAQQELLEKLPAICPYCGAPTSGKITCEFCGSNLLSKVSQ